MSGNQPKAHGFTLIELLVVIAIIAILASLSMSALARAKGRSRQAVCLSNLKQVDLAFRFYLDENDDQFPDARSLKSRLGFKPWNDWPKSDPRSGWAANQLESYLATTKVWLCPAVFYSPLRHATQAVQPVSESRTNELVSYWLWRFDRIEDPVPLDNFWNKKPMQALQDLRLANNPAAGLPDSLSQVELAVDPYFPATIAAVAPELKGHSVHPKGRNVLMLDGHAAFVRDARLR